MIVRCSLFSRPLYLLMRCDCMTYSYGKVWILFSCVLSAKWFLAHRGLYNACLLNKWVYVCVCIKYKLSHLSWYITWGSKHFMQTEFFLVESNFKYTNIKCYFWEFHYDSFYDGNNHLQWIISVVWVVMSQLRLHQSTRVNTSHLNNITYLNEI